MTRGPTELRSATLSVGGRHARHGNRSLGGMPGIADGWDRAATAWPLHDKPEGLPGPQRQSRAHKVANSLKATQIP
jgi:hypothetical protein